MKAHRAILIDALAGISRGFLFGLAMFGTVALLAVLSTGCAVGRTPDGQTVAGFPIGEVSPESAAEFASAAAGFLPSPFNWIAGALGAVLTVGGPVAAVKYRGDAKASTAAHASERKGWDERDTEQQRFDAEYYAGQRDAAISARTAPPLPAPTPTPTTPGDSARGDLR